MKTIKNFSLILTTLTCGAALGCNDTVVFGGATGSSEAQAGAGGGYATSTGAGIGGSPSDASSSTASDTGVSTSSASTSATSGAGGSPSSASTSATTGAGGSPSGAWAKSFGNEGGQYVAGLVVDPAGKLVLAGSFQGMLAVGGAPAPSQDRACYVTKRDADGGFLWRTVLTSLECWATAVAVDPQGNVYLTGSTLGPLSVGGEQLTSKTGAFLAKLDPQGEMLWAKAYGYDGAVNYASPVATRGLGISALPGGEIVVSGVSQAPFAVEAATLQAGAFVFKLDAAGSPLFTWTTPFGGETAPLDMVRNVVNASGTILANIGDLDLVALDPQGNELWRKKQGSHLGSPGGIAVDGHGDILLAGHLNFGVDLGAGPLEADHAFVAKYDSSGNPLWTRELPYPKGAATQIAVATDGTSAITGLYVAPLDADNAIAAMFVAELNASGAITYSQPIKSPSLDINAWAGGAAIALDPAGGIYAGGNFTASVTVAGETLQSIDYFDILLARLLP